MDQFQGPAGEEGHLEVIASEDEVWPRPQAYETRLHGHRLGQSLRTRPYGRIGPVFEAHGNLRDHLAARPAGLVPREHTLPLSQVKGQSHAGRVDGP